MLDSGINVPFTINFWTGWVHTTAPLDRELQKRWELKVTVEDDDPFASRTATTMLTVDVVDENDNKPQLLNAEYDIFIPKPIAKGSDSARIFFNFTANSKTFYCRTSAEKMFLNQQILSY